MVTMTLSSKDDIHNLNDKSSSPMLESNSNYKVNSHKETDGSFPEVKHPFEQANIFSRLLLCWMLPTFKRGWKHTLTVSDIPAVPKELQSVVLCDYFEKIWYKYSAKHDGPIALLLTIYKTFRFELTMSHFITGIEELVIHLLQPVCLGLLLRYLSDKSQFTENEGLLFAVGVCVLALLLLLLHHPNFFMLMRLSLKIRTVLSAFIFRKAVKLSNSSLGKVSIGQIVNHMSNDVRKFDEVVLFLPYLWIAPIQLMIVGWILWKEVGPVSVIGLLLLIMYVPLQSTMGRIYAKLRTRINYVADKRSCLMNEIITGMKVIKMYAWEYAFGDVIKQIRHQEFCLLRKMSLFQAVNQGLFLVSTKLIMLITLTAYIMHSNNQVTSERVFVTLTMIYIVRLSITLFFQLAVSFGSEAWASIKRIHKFLTLEESQEMRSINQGLTTDECYVKFEDVSITWNEKGNPVLRNISFTVKQNELLVVIGQVGSGKSSLLMSIIGELPPCKGILSVEGSIAYVPQEPWLFSGSVKENIVFGLPFNDRKYQEVITACDLFADFKNFPLGDESLVGERGVLMSGGQKARICLARALYFDADIYILDDPLSAVDAKISHHIFNRCIQFYLRNKVRILVTHQLQYVKYATEILILEEGKTLAIGTYEKLKSMDLNFNSFIQNEMLNAVPEPTTREHYKSITSITSKESIREVEKIMENVLPRMEEEKRETGAVAWSVYFKFSLAGGGIFLVMAMLLTNIAAHSLSIVCDWWLSVWVDGVSKRNRNISTDDADQNKTVFKVERSQDTVDYYEIYVILSVASIFFLITSSIANFMLCVLSARNLHNDMFSHLLHSPMLFFNTNSIGRILNRFTKDIGQIDDLIARIFNDVISLGLLSLSIVVMVGVINYTVLFPTVGLCFVFVWLRKFYLNTLRDIKRLEGTTKSPVFSHVSTSIFGLSSVRSFGRTEQFIEEFNYLQDKNSAVWFMFIGSVRWFGITLDMISFLFITSTTMFCFFMSDELTSGQVGFALSQAIQMSGMFQWVVRQTAELESQMTSVERVLEYGQLTPEASKETVDEKKPSINWPFCGRIKLENMSLKYSPSEPYILKSLSCDIQGSEKVGIVGRTGAGKSSLITSLFRLTEPEGIIKIDNIVINELGLHDLRNSISIIPQDPLLFTNTMRFNLDPFSKHKDQELWNSLDQVCLKEFVSSLPNGLSTMLTEGGSNFSVGQRQLVCLARCLLKKNKILILDEATANIDMNTDFLIQKTIRKEFNECTVLTIAHRLDTVIDSDKIMVLDSGNIVEFDTPKNLLKNPENLFYLLVKETDIDIDKIVLQDSNIISTESQVPEK